jgi:hypothetical protein
MSNKLYKHERSKINCNAPETMTAAINDNPSKQLHDDKNLTMDIMKKARQLLKDASKESLIIDVAFPISIGQRAQGILQKLVAYGVIWDSQGCVQLTWYNHVFSIAGSNIIDLIFYAAVNDNMRQHITNSPTGWDIVNTLLVSSQQTPPTVNATPKLPLSGSTLDNNKSKVRQSKLAMSSKQAGEKKVKQHEPVRSAENENISVSSNQAVQQNATNADKQGRPHLIDQVYKLLKGVQAGSVKTLAPKQTVKRGKVSSKQLITDSYSNQAASHQTLPLTVYANSTPKLPLSGSTLDINQGEVKQSKRKLTMSSKQLVKKVRLHESDLPTVVENTASSNQEEKQQHHIGQANPKKRGRPRLIYRPTQI